MTVQATANSTTDKMSLRNEMAIATPTTKMSTAANRVRQTIFASGGSSLGNLASFGVPADAASHVSCDVVNIFIDVKPLKR